MDMNILKYMAFVKTVEYGSFTKAAEVLNYSQSGISRMIHDLESESNLTLLERSRHGVKLSSDGSKIFPYAKNLCLEYEKLQMCADDLHGVQSGIIRIGTFSSVATHWIPNIIKAFQKDYPNIDYELLIGDYMEIECWIAEGRVDCGFVHLPTKPMFEVISLAQDRFMAILPENHRLAALDVVPIDELCCEPFILLERGQKEEVAKLLERNHVSPHVHLSIWDDYAIMSMVEGGLGLSILPELILKRIPYHIVARPLDVAEYRTIGVALRDRETASIATKRFLEYLDYREG